MSDNRVAKYGLGYCPVCQRGNLALTKDGHLRPHNVMPWIKRKCLNRTVAVQTTKGAGLKRLA